MARRFTLCVTVAGLALAVLPGSAFGRTLVVGDGGPGCRDARFATIQGALDAALPGDLVPVCPGTYRENVRVRADRVKLYARKRHEAVIERPSPDLSQASIVSIDGQSVLLRGFTITGAPPTGPCGEHTDAVSVFGSGVVEHNRIRDLGCNSIRYGVDNSFGSGRFTVQDNEISGFNEIGVLAGGQPYVLVQRNVVRSGGGIGIRFGHPLFGGSGAGAIQANTVEDTSAGVYADGLEQESFNLRVSGNRLRRNGYGISVLRVGQGVGSDQFRFTRIERNFVLDSVQDGITVDSGRGFIHHNRALGSGGLDCHDPDPAPQARPWKDNVGVTDSPSTLCRAP